MYREKKINQKEYEEAKAYDLAKDFRQPEAPVNNQSGFLYNYLYEEAVRILIPIYYEKDGVTKEEYEASEDLQKNMMKSPHVNYVKMDTQLKQVLIKIFITPCKRPLHNMDQCLTTGCSC